MDIEKPFTSFDEVEKHALELRVLSETAALRFGNHCHALADKEFRSLLVKGAVTDAIHDIKPVQKAAELMTSGGIGTQMLMGLLTRKGSFMRRLLTSVAVVVVPNLLARVPWADVANNVGHTLRKSRTHEHNGHGMN